MTSANEQAADKKLAHRRLPVILFALPVFLAVFLSNLTITPQEWLTMLWLAPAVVFVGLLTRGNTVLIPSAIGIAAGTWLMSSPISTPVALLSGLVAPYVANLLLKNTAWRETSHMRQTVKLLTITTLVLAPLSALINAGLGGRYGAIQESLTLFGWQWLIEAISCAITVRILLGLMPNDGSPFCAKTALQNSVRGKWSLAKGPVLFVAIVLVSAAAAFVCHTGYHVAARIAALIIFGIAGYTALFFSWRQASSCLFTAVFAAGLLRLHTTYDQAPDAVMSYLAEFEMTTLFMAIVLILLNASAEERRTQNARLRRQAFTNATSDLPNLRSLEEALRTSSLQTQDGDRSPLSVSLIDVSIIGLSRWIDVVGHKTFANAETDIAIYLTRILDHRFGEIYHLETGRFVLLSDDPSRLEQIQRLLHDQLNGKDINIGIHVMSVQYALSVVDVPAGPFDPKLAIATLSLAQHDSLTSSDHYSRLYLNEDRVAAHRAQFTWVEKVRSMLQSDRLRLLAQPIADCHATKSPNFHFEVLARLEGDDGKMLTPDKFLPAIASGGLQVLFDKQVVALALSLISEYETTLSAKQIGTCAINITGPTISYAGFTSFLFMQLEKYNVSSSSIMIEITESESIFDLPTAQANLKLISEHGIRVAVDDFGTGLATFDYIRTLQPDVLKIDGSFVKRYATSQLDREIVHSIHRLAEAIGAQTVAECVEDLEIAAQMQSVGVDYLQGWGIARPMPFTEMFDTYSPSPVKTKTAELTVEAI